MKLMIKDSKAEMRKHYDVNKNNEERIRLINKVNENHKRE